MTEPARTLPATDESHPFVRVWSAPPGILGWIREINNIPIATRYMATAFLFFLVGGVQALLLRIQLGTPENTFLDAQTYNQIFTMHGTTMMFLFVIPFIEALANYVLPLMLGTRDLPFPRLTSLSYWTYVFGGLFLYSSFVVGLAPDGGWFAYVPLTSLEFSPGLNIDYWLIGLSVAEVAGIGAAAELIVAVVKLRAPGMSLGRMPLFAWAMLIVAIMIIFAFTPLVVVTGMLEFDRKLGTRFFDIAAGGDPLLWQHLFWVFGHPEVYIMLLPAIGIVSHIVQTFTRRPIVGYRIMVGAMIAIGVVSFSLWAHHMFAVGMSMAAMSFFAAASLLIAIPSGLQVFGWIATLWQGRAEWQTPLLFAVGFIVLFVFGGITGVMLASAPFDAQAHDSHFVVAHFHYVLVGGVIFPLVGGLHYWLPKFSGRMLSERLGRWTFWLMFVGFNVAFLPMHVTGLLGMPRRVYTYQAGLGWDLPNLLSTIGAFILALGVLLFVINVVVSLRRGERATDNPWGGDTLEWAVTSPPPVYQFWSLPVVHTRHPLWEQRTLDTEDAVVAAELEAMRGQPASWRATLLVSTKEGRPEGISWIPGPTIWPVILSGGFVLLFTGALINSISLTGAGLVVSGVATAGWFWPTRSQKRAIDEMRSRGFRVIRDRAPGTPLPLVLVGRDSAGWWGMMVLITVLAVAVLSLVTSYLYLAARWPEQPQIDTMEMILAATCGLVLLSGAGLLRLTTHPRTGTLARRRVGLAGTSLVALVGMGLLWALYGYGESTFTRALDAHGSFVYTLLGVQGLLVAGGLIGMIVAQLWLWRRPDDPRGDAVTELVLPYWYFVAASWVVVFLTLYL
ncbi:MAG: cytochrome c oxidase subunit I [Gemmatimonadota bacterium]|nr:cytochrome c oxidase subunit I [Gemmatimonadota bacterium]